MKKVTGHRGEGGVVGDERRIIEGGIKGVVMYKASFASSSPSLQILKDSLSLSNLLESQQISLGE